VGNAVLLIFRGIGGGPSVGTVILGCAHSVGANTAAAVVDGWARRGDLQR